LLGQFYPEVQHELFLIPGYSHNDVFMGVNSHVDVFPRFVEFLDTHA
jgi:cholesterol oxidase